MTILTAQYPSIIHPHRHCDNGLFPEVSFYAQAVGGLNHLVAYRRKPVYRRTWPLGTSGGASGTVARWYCRTGYGAQRLVAFVNLGFDDRAIADDPYIDAAITKVGGSTTTLSFHGGALQGASTDAPEWWLPQIQTCDVDANAYYSGAVTFNDNVRVLSIMVYEDFVPTVDEGTTYFSEWSPSAGSPIYAANQSTLLAGLGAIIRKNRGLRLDWSRDDGTARTRTSATLANLHDGSTTGTPTAATPGYQLVTQYHNTFSATTVPITAAVYASIPAGSGTVKLRDTAGNDAATVTVNNATPQWFTAAGSLTVGTGQKYDLMFAGDGVNQISVYAVSIFEEGT